MKHRNALVVWLIASTFAIAAPATAGPAPGSGSPQTASSNPSQQNDNAHFGRQSSGTEGAARAPIVVRVDGGFDWVSAGVGAAGGLGLVLVAGVAASALRRRAPRVA